MDGKNGYENKAILKMYFEGHKSRRSSRTYKKEKMGKIKVKNTKSPILSSTYHFWHFWVDLRAHTGHLRLTKYIFGIFY